MTDDTIGDEKAIYKESGFTAGFGNEGWSKQPGIAIVKGDEYVQHDAPTRRSHICWYVELMSCFCLVQVSVSTTFFQLM